MWIRRVHNLKVMRNFYGVYYHVIYGIGGVLNIVLGSLFLSLPMVWKAAVSLNQQ